MVGIFNTKIALPHRLWHRHFPTATQFPSLSHLPHLFILLTMCVTSFVSRPNFNTLSCKNTKVYFTVSFYTNKKQEVLPYKP